MFDLATLSLSTLAKVYNALSETQVKSFSDRAAAVKRVQFLMDAKNLIATKVLPTEVAVADAAIVIDKVVAVFPKALKHRGGVKGKAGRKPKAWPLDPRVVTKVVENPKHRGAALRFANWQVGSTVQAYVDACVAAGASQALAHADVEWDLAHSFVEVK